MRLFVIITSALLSVLGIFISPQYAALPLLPLFLYLEGIRLKPIVVSPLLLLSVPLDNLVVYASVLELVLLSSSW